MNFLIQLLAMEREFYRPYELARACGVTTRTVRRWVIDGAIQSVMTPKGTHRIPRQAVVRLLQDQSVPKK